MNTIQTGLRPEDIENPIRIPLIEDAIRNTARAIEDRVFIRILEAAVFS